MLTPNAVKLIMIALVLFSYIFDTILTLLNLKHHTPQLPDEVKDVYDQEKYAKSQEYKKANTKLSLISSTFFTLLVTVALYFEWFGKLDQWVRTLTSNPLLVTLLFFAIVYYAYQILKLPFDIYDTFVIEEKFGFNRTTPKIFITDLLKSWLIAAIIGGLLLGALTWIYLKTEQYFWLLALLVIALFQLFISMFYVDIFVPLFNKLTPLPDGELRERLEAYAQKVGYQLKHIMVIDSSKRSTKLNAYFSGLGPKKKIILYDTLVEKLNPAEIEAVLAHEVGHYKHKHILWITIISLLETAFFLYLFQLFSHNQTLAQALGAQQPSFHIALIALSILYAPLELILGVITQLISRTFERQADDFAKKTSNAQSLINALKILSAENLSNLTPHPLYVFFKYSHPPLLERIRRLKQ